MCIKLIKNDNKNIYNVTKDFQINAVPLIFYSLKRILKKNPQKYEAAQLFSTLIMRSNISWAANQHIRMISEGSCDTTDWSNDADNSALITGINYIPQYIKIEKSYFKL